MAPGPSGKRADEQKRPKPCEIVVEKFGKKLGLVYDDSDGECLVIKNINPGVLYEPCPVVIMQGQEGNFVSELQQCSKNGDV